MRCRASGSTIVSASIAQASSPVETSRPALSASALPPFSLSTTTSEGVRRERYSPRIGCVSIRRRIGALWISTRSKSRRSVSSVPSAEPSLTTTTSRLG